MRGVSSAACGGRRACCGLPVVHAASGLVSGHSAVDTISWNLLR